MPPRGPGSVRLVFMRVMLMLLLMLSALAGCSFVKTPTARVTDVQVDRATDEGARLVVTVQLDNPNAVELPLPKARYRVAVEGADPFTFTTVPDATLPRKGSIAITLSAAFPGVVQPQGLGYNVSGAVTYLPPGEVRELLTDYRIPLPSAGFSESGQLP